MDQRYDGTASYLKEVIDGLNGVEQQKQHERIQGQGREHKRPWREEGKERQRVKEHTTHDYLLNHCPFFSCKFILYFILDDNDCCA